MGCRSPEQQYMHQEVGLVPNAQAGVQHHHQCEVTADCQTYVNQIQEHAAKK